MIRASATLSQRTIGSSQYSYRLVTCQDPFESFVVRRAQEVQRLLDEFTHSKYTKGIQKSGKKRAKNKTVSNFGEMLEIATNRRWEQTRHKNSKDAKYGMYRYDTTFAFPVKDKSGTFRAYDAELIVRNASDGKKYLYDIVGIKEKHWHRA